MLILSYLDLPTSPKLRSLLLASSLMACAWVVAPSGVQAQKKVIRVIRVKNACAFGEIPKSEYGVVYNEKPEHLISKMVESIGFEDDRIYISSSDDLSYALSTLRDDGNPEIIVNSHFGSNPNRWYDASIVAHELAHILHRDIYSADVISIPKELRADYYAGFWAHKNNCDSVGLVEQPFRELAYDSIHPRIADRLQAIDSGWRVAERPFSWGDTTSLTMADRLKPFLNLYFTVTNSSKKLKDSSHYTVYFHLTTKQANYPFDSLASRIDHVSYVLHDKTFKHPFVVSNNVNDDGFGYSLTRVWIPFPLVCLVYFRDSSVAFITKQFSLIPTNKPTSYALLQATDSVYHDPTVQPPGPGAKH